MSTADTAVMKRNYFMEPTRIPESEWHKKEATLPIRQTLVKKVNASSVIFY